VSEVRITDALTGGQKGKKPERFNFIPPDAMAEVARVYGYGATKYEDRNWEKGYDWGLSLDALHRHINAFERREGTDPESGLHHLAHAVFHCLALMTYQKFGLGTDTRSTVGVWGMRDEDLLADICAGDCCQIEPRNNHEDGYASALASPATPTPERLANISESRRQELEFVADHEFNLREQR
jgi:hypothetical protein